MHGNSPKSKLPKSSRGSCGSSGGGDGCGGVGGDSAQDGHGKVMLTLGGSGDVLIAGTGGSLWVVKAWSMPLDSCSSNN